MSEDGSKPDNGLSVEELIALKHALNKSITYKGFNPAEIEELRKISREKWTEVQTTYKEWKEQTRVLNNWIIIAVGVVGVSLMPWGGWLRIIGIVLFAWAASEMFKRAGHDEGYIYGYEHGFSEGINRVLGINKEEAYKIHETSIEMEMDSGLLRTLNQTRKAEKASDLGSKIDSQGLRSKP